MISKRAKQEMAVAAVIGLVTVAVAYTGVRSYLREGRALESYQAEARHRGRPDSALPTVAAALARDAERFELVALHADLKLQHGELDDAAAAFERLTGREGQLGAVGSLGEAVIALERKRAAQPARGAWWAEAPPGVVSALDAAQAEASAAVAGARGALQLELGRLAEARELLEKALAPGEDAGWRTALAAHANLGAVATAQGEHKVAAEHFGAAVVLSRGDEALKLRYARAVARAVAEERLVGDALQMRIRWAQARTRAPRGSITPYLLSSQQIAIIQEGIGVAEARGGELERGVATLLNGYRNAQRGERKHPRIEHSLARNLAAAHLMRYAAEPPGRARRQHAKDAGSLLNDVAEGLTEQAKDATPQQRDRLERRALEMNLAAGVCYAEAEFYAEAKSVFAKVETLLGRFERDYGRVDFLATFARQRSQLFLARATMLDQRKQLKDAIETYKAFIAASPEHPLISDAERRIRSLELKR
jgi:tetratricopeptide (TPR) repeat protein